MADQKYLEKFRRSVPENSSKIMFFPLHLTRKPEVLALCLFYTIISVLANAADSYNISIWLDPQVSELGGKNMIFEEFSTDQTLKSKFFKNHVFST